jgi:hypothetical protein
MPFPMATVKKNALYMYLVKFLALLIKCCLLLYPKGRQPKVYFIPN